MPLIRYQLLVYAQRWFNEILFQLKQVFAIYNMKIYIHDITNGEIFWAV